MTTNSDTEFAPDHLTVGRQSPIQSRWAAEGAVLEFGRFQMLLRRRLLVADGVPVQLGTRALDVLLILIEADGSLVTKENLLARVWPGIHVSDENLKVQISALRKALGQDRDLIRTETGRGYRFTAEVKSIAAGSALRHAARRRQRPAQRPVSRWVTARSFPECSQPEARLSNIPKSRLFKALAFA